MVHAWQIMMAVAREDEAATMPEYALMIALIALVCVAAVTLIGPAASGKFLTIQAAISGA